MTGCNGFGACGAPIVRRWMRKGWCRSCWSDAKEKYRDVPETAEEESDN